MSRTPGPSQKGAYAVEFGFVLIAFFIMLFGVLEVARSVYLFNTLQEVTRRAARSASVTDPGDHAALAQVRRAAIFRSGGGGLLLGAPVTDAHVRIDYLSLQNTQSGMVQVTIPDSQVPRCPARQKLACAADSGAPGCIRFVRVRICEPGIAQCSRVPYKSMLPLVPVPFDLPLATSVTRAESLGYAPGAAMCN